jgi:hypothetical protein
MFGRRFTLFALVLLLFFVRLAPAQTYNAHGPEEDAKPALNGPAFRLERQAVNGGAELLTIFGKTRQTGGVETEIPLISVLRDTLGDNVAENDRLRYVWLLSATRPTFWQRVASGVPFLYGRVGGPGKVDANKPPPALFDVNGSRNAFTRQVLWFALQNLLFDPTGVAVRATARAYRRNAGEYQRAQISRALAALTLFEAETGAAPALSQTEMRELQAKLSLSTNRFGWLVDDTYYRQAHQQRVVLERDIRGHNWELLRQRAEAEGLYFEPLSMPDGSATHALLWVAAEDLAKNEKRRWNSRFLNFDNPWKDKRLRQWQGYRETRHFDAENRQVPADTPGARATEMIPLAVYGLDHPKIPILLVDFRDAANPKKRELSRRLLEDTARNILALSSNVFGDLPFFLGRAVYDFVTGRRGLDINQPSRFRAYAQLKLLLSLSASLDPDLEAEIDRRLDKATVNPRENDGQAEGKIALAQYQALLKYAQSPDGLARQIDRDRRAEMVPLKHGKPAQMAFKALNLLTFGWYVRREKATPELLEKLDLSRRFDFHERFLREVVKSGPRAEVAWDINDVRRSLQFVANHHQFAGKKAAKAVAALFERTQDDETRRLCVHSLYRINSETAKTELLKIYRNTPADAPYHALSGQFLRQSVREAQRITPADAKAISREVGLQ